MVARLPFHPKSRQAPSSERVVGSGELLKLHQPDEVGRITCVSGCLWITQEGDGTDYVLQPGDSIVLRPKGLVLVEGLHASLARLVPREA